MPDNINVEISTKKPVVAANLTELRYLVFQGMTGDTGQSAYALAVELGFEGTEEDWLISLKGERGETLGWDVTDDGEGNVEMVYPDGVINSQKSVLFEEQTLTTAQQTQARTNIGAASAATVNALNDTVEEHDADILALETIADEQASVDNALDLPRYTSGSAAGGSGITYSFDSSTGAYVLTGTASGRCYVNASKGNINPDGDELPTARKPVAGVYRLEITTDAPMDFTKVWGRFYYSPVKSNSVYVDTDATGKTIEVYLDGDTMVTGRFYIEDGTSVTGVNLTIALRRVGTPELGELLVDQINQMQALQRKTLSMLDTLRSAYAFTSNADAGVYTIPRVMDIVDPADLNSIGKVYCVTLVRYNSSTLHSPYSEGVTARNSGLVLDFHGGANIGIQVGFPAGDEIICARKLYQGAFGGWVAIGGATSGT